MFHFSVWGPNEPVSELENGLERLWNEPARREELISLMKLLAERQAHLTSAYDGASRVPLHVHAAYTRDEVLAAFGHKKPSAVRQGVVWIPDERADLFFITLKKTEQHYSPTTRYQDYALSARRFHWESQNTTSQESPTGQRYMHHAGLGSTVHLFIRESKTGTFETPPYLYAGPARYLSHTGERPMQITWEMEHALPSDILEVARVAA